MNRHRPQSAWPRNDSPAAKALVLIDWIMRNQVAVWTAIGVVSAIAAEVLP